MNKILLSIAMLCAFGVKAQDLLVNLTNSTIEIFPISNIQSIKFNSSSMEVYENDGTLTSLNISDIIEYSFDKTSNLSEESIQSSLTIFPNPASNLVFFQIDTKETDQISIEVLDANGKFIEEIYRGSHIGNKTYQWKSNAAKGTYYCRISSVNKTIIKPIIIQ